jgi:quercetin dioxygenase-like cupin family protein
MDVVSLTATADQQLELARQSNSGRAAHTVYGGHEHFLRQTVIALVGGRETSVHRSPGEATLLVLQGTLKVTAGDDTWQGAVGDFLIIPAGTHCVLALEDAVMLLSTRADT